MRTQQDIEKLEEPTRSKALQVVQELQARGYDSDEAIDLAYRQAAEWETSRHQKPPSEQRT